MLANLESNHHGIKQKAAIEPNVNYNRYLIVPLLFAKDGLNLIIT